MSNNDIHWQALPPDAGAVISTRFLDAVARQLPASQEKQGDRKLDEAHAMTTEFHHLISEDDHKIIEEKIILARDIKIGLDSKTGLQRLIHAREYRKAAKGAQRFAESVSSRARDNALFARRLNRPEPDIIDNAIRVARHLYRCKFICEDAFPSPSTKGVWVACAWSDACVREGMNPNLFTLRDEEFVDSSMMFLFNMKTEIKHTVESSYGFDPSQAPDSISHNARHAQALLTSMAFIYRETNDGVNRHHPYRHPIIQKAINVLWFQNKDSDGIVFYEYFAPIPIQAIALALTVIECCIDEWTDGTWKNSSWNEKRYKTVYSSHVKSLTDLRDYNHPQSGDFMGQIQRDLLQGARAYAGAPPEPVTGSSRLHPGAIDAALQEDLPEYDEHNTQIPTINISSVS